METLSFDQEASHSPESIVETVVTTSESPSETHTLDGDHNLNSFQTEETDLKVENLDGVNHEAPAEGPLDPLAELRRKHRQRENVQARVVKWQRNGLEVELETGERAFMPNDNIDRDPNRNIANYFGKTLPVRITNIKGVGKTAEITVSHRAFIEDDLRRQGKETIQNLNVGDEVDGKIKHFNANGVVVDIGPGVEATIRTKDLTWENIEHPYEVVKRGDSIHAKILNLDRGRLRVQLGIRQLTVDPFIERISRYEVGQVVNATVSSLGDFGADVELEPGMTAFLPISEISWSRIPTVADALTVGDAFEVKLMTVNPEDRRITVSKKQLVENPLRIIENTYKVGSDHNGTIKEVTRGGVVISLPHNVEGFVPRRELSHDRIERIEDVFKVGKPIEGVRVIEYDKRTGRITLSCTAAERDAQRSTLREYRATAKASSFSLGDLASLKEKLEQLERGG